MILRIEVKSYFLPGPVVKLLKPGNYIVGRDPSCDIVIPDPYVSRKHLRLFFEEGKWFVVDLGSKNGTFVNGEDIRGKRPVELSEGMDIVLGLTTITVVGFEEGD